MAKFYKIQIDSIYLSASGANAAPFCKLAIPNLEDLLTPMTGAAVAAADGTSVHQLVPWTKGKTFEIQVDVLTEAVWEQLRDLIIDALENDTDFEVTGTGDIGNFTVNAKPNPQKPFSAARFKNERIYGVNFRLITV